jgi:hypothetical protein
LIFENFQELWGPDFSSVFAATMSYNRFVFLLNHLRLDNASAREEARKHDKFAAARKVKKILVAVFLVPLIIEIVFETGECKYLELETFLLSNEGTVSSSSMRLA